MVALLLGACAGWIILSGLAPDSAESTTIPDAYPAYVPLVLLPDVTATPSCLPWPPLDSSNVFNEAAIAAGLNQQRANHGLFPLPSHDAIVQASRRHSNDMATYNLTSHVGSDGTVAGDRLRDACYSWSRWAEIIGWGFGGNVNAMIAWWMNSPPHRDTILSSAYAEFGVGYIARPGSEWGHYWTVDFGVPASAALGSSADLRVCRAIAVGPAGGSVLTWLSAESCPE